MIPNRIFALAVAGMVILQTALLGFMIESRASILRSGTEVLLKTRPIDPRDLFRGDYVILNYDISDVPIALIAGARPEEGSSQRLHVRLVPGPDGYWNISEASFETLARASQSVVMTTKPITVYDWLWQGNGNLRVDYGIERFYVPEGEGLVLEEARNEGRLSVAVRVSESGQAQIRALFLDEQELYEEPLY
ncbi:GDYXXLXY domain-containing protein [Peteryoungia desertarenae]|uniref:GDYXXLXY domain-containing protein n=1 Tax=Peteryoungia desertarenae TaxID=1813451 RepID=A0ABX6QNZ8_9HYPH|nr:GDYXXLXY domain-containing protein [Peteryoungia desertarenae]QLF70309.1 GDYXXLXY domain-containing protein [Peteryoungia desertarenae]